MYHVYMSSTLVTLRLDPKVKKKLDKLAKAMNRTRSFLAAEAIREYVSLNEWQIAEIRRGIEEADRGEFASEEEVARILKKWAGKREG